MGFIGLILGNWQLVVIGLLLVTLAGTGVYIKVIKSEVATAQAEANTLKGELAVSQASVKGLQQAIVDQNAAIDKMKADAARRAKINKVEVDKAKTASTVFKRSAEDLMKVRATTGIPVCNSANKLIDQEILSAK